MTQEKPLHVKVAEALGWAEPELCGSVEHHGSGYIEDRRRWYAWTPWQVRAWQVREQRGDYIPRKQPVPELGAQDIDHLIGVVTKAVGPVTVWRSDPGAEDGDYCAGAAADGIAWSTAGQGPREALARLILSLAAAGKLPR